MRSLIAACLAAMSCAGIAQAQTTSLPAPAPGVAESTLTLGEALRRADVLSAAREAGKFGIEAAEAGRLVAGLRPNPTISIDVENIAGTGPYKGIDEAEATIGFAVPLELGGKRSARIAVADAQTTRARIDAITIAANLKLQVTQAYIEAVAAQRRLIVAQDQLSITAENLRIARDRVTVGANSPIDEQRAMLLTAKAQAEFERSRNSADAARIALGYYIGSAVPASLDQMWFDRIEVPTNGSVPAANPDGTLALAAAGADVTTSEVQLRLARSQRLPDLTLSAGTRRLRATGDHAMVFGISVPFPIFNNGRAAVNQASAQRNQLEARRRLIRFEAEQAIVGATADRDRAAAGIRASGPVLAAAQEAVRIARIGYGEGKFDQLVLLEAEQALLDARTTAIDVRAQYHDAEARLARLTMPAPRGN